MKSNPKQFLEPPPLYTRFEEAAVAILPVPYEGGVSYGTGTAGGPDAVIEASAHLELYDEVLEAEAYRMGISTVMLPEIYSDAEQMNATVYKITKDLMAQNKFVVMLGGDHSISSACLRALREKYSPISVIQLDAHADLRDSYEGSPHSHACAMARMRELTESTLQIGIRSLSRQEARRIEREKLAVCTMADLRSGAFDVQAALDALVDPVYLTVDVDVFDWSVVRSTGTPEPGGFFWDEAIALLRQIFFSKTIVGIDVVEFGGNGHDRNSAFAVAKLIYKMLGFKLAAEVDHGRMSWPAVPRGGLFK
ncbi:MAG: agmatinase [Desulfobacterales bacterium]|nr:agmatinase [Desulfobacterales bacterium]